VTILANYGPEPDLDKCDIVEAGNLEILLMQHKSIHQRRSGDNFEIVDVFGGSKNVLNTIGQWISPEN
jgi:hypothetical protein